MANAKAAIVGVSSILLVAMVIAVAVGVSKKGGSSGEGTVSASSSQTSTTTKAVKQICAPADYKESCEEALSGTNSTDPKVLIKAGFNATVKHITGAINNSSLIQEATKDPMTKDALENCRELLRFSIDDLTKSLDKVGTFEMTKMKEYITDIKTWLSGAITYQQTCLEAFENTTGDTGEKMQKVLKVSGELTSNGLAILEELEKALATYSLPTISHFSSYTGMPDVDVAQDGSVKPDVDVAQDGSGKPETVSRRLMSSNDGFPKWLNKGQRNLLQANPGNVKPNVVVAQDGSGKHKTISEALKEVPMKNTVPFVIYVKAGVYKEYVNITKKMTNVVLVGDGPTKTKITGNKSFGGGINTYKTATVCADGENFMAKNIGFENSAGGNMHQAVALRVSSDRSIVYNCRMDGYQDTLYAHAHRQFYRDCIVTGTVDFVFGDAAAVFQNCRMEIRKPLPNQNNMVTAQGRKDKRATTGFVLQNCTFTGAPDYMPVKAQFKSYLGRPWKNYSRTVIMQSQIDDVIDPTGWAPWQGTVHLDTLWYAEFLNRGPGANTNGRVKWAGIQNINQQAAGGVANQFIPQKFIDGDVWIPATGVPYNPGMMKV